jgi:undecaprenyl diphosphate synthase
MQQSTSPAGFQGGLHVAIIMDGSGRWALARGWPRSLGHRAGMEAVRRIVPSAAGLGIGVLTLHAFSSQNWRRPTAEVRTLFEIFEIYLRSEITLWTRQSIRVSVLGRRDRLPESLTEAIESAEMETANGKAFELRLAIDYSAREAIVRAAERLNSRGENSEDSFFRLLAEVTRASVVPEVDLLIRTGGEQRLSDFFLWECAYTELYFTRCLWPDFSPRDLETAIRDFQSRERRFGSIPEGVTI